MESHRDCRMPIPRHKANEVSILSPLAHCEDRKCVLSVYGTAVSAVTACQSLGAALEHAHTHIHTHTHCTTDDRVCSQNLVQYASKINEACIRTPQAIE